MDESLTSNGMTERRMAAVDAQTYWMSAKIPNDQFLLYGFAGVPSDLQQALGVVRERARGCPELRLRVRGSQRSDLPGVGARRCRCAPVRGARSRRQQLVGMSGRGRPAGRRSARRRSDDLAAARFHAGRRSAGCRGCGNGGGAAGRACAGRRHSVLGTGGADVRPRLSGAGGGGAAAVSRRRAALAQPSKPPAPIGSCSATPRPAWCPRRRNRGRCYAPTRGRREPAVSAR